MPVLEQYELQGLLREAAIYVSAATIAAKTISGKRETDRGTEEGLQTILEFLEKAAEDLDQVASGQPELSPHRQTIFLTKEMAMKAIEKLPMDEAVGFLISRDGQGRCSVRMWFAGRGA